MLLPSSAARRLLPYAVTASLLVLTGCAGEVEVDAPEVSGATADACHDLVDALPDELIGEPARDVDAGDGVAAAWGEAPRVMRWRDHPIVLTCGVGEPEDFGDLSDDLSTCETVSGVDWFVREDGFADLAKDLEMFTIGYEPGVKLVIPSEYRGNPANVADSLAALADPLKDHLEHTGRCTS